MPEAIFLERLNVSANLDSQLRSGLSRRRVYILPTRQGITFSFLLLVMLLGAINYNNNMAFMLTFLLAGLFMVCIIHSYRNLRGLLIKGVRPEAVFTGDTARFPLILDNYGGRARFAIKVSVRSVSRLMGPGPEDERHALVTDVPADHWQQIEMPVPATRRGWLHLPSLVLSTTYPLGLFRAWSTVDLDLSCLVYPRPLGNLPLPLGNFGQASSESGEENGIDDFNGFRHYHPGDSIRNIAWKALAREQPLLIKRFKGDGDRQVILSWDAPVLRQKPVENRLSQLCRWILDAELGGAAYALDIPGITLETGRGRTHRKSCLEALALYGISND